MGGVVYQVLARVVHHIHPAPRFVKRVEDKRGSPLTRKVEWGLSMSVWHVGI